MCLIRFMCLGLMILPTCFAAAQDKYELRSFVTTKLSDRFFAEGAAFGDLNNDKAADLVAGPYWFEGPDYKRQHTIYPAKPFDPHGYSDNFFAYVCDFNRDGWNDVLVYGFPGKDASWYENPHVKADGPEQEWKRHKVLDRVDNESPTWGDITGDGNPEIICSSGGFFGYASPDWAHAENPWTFHRISDQSAGGQFTHGLGFGDVNGDGRADLLEKGGWWEQPAALSGDPVWKKHAVPFAGGGAQMYAYDVDGDGLSDVITSRQAHGFGLVWHQQVRGEGEPKFVQRIITGDKPSDSPYGVAFSQIHAIDLLDMNGDGLKDIVTGKRYWAHGPKGDPEPDAPAVVYWFELVRGEKGSVDWVPHLVHDDSGVGVQVTAGDFSGDGRPDIVVGNKKGIFAHVQQVKPATKAEFEASRPKRSVPMAQGLSPEEAAKAMTVPPGFQVKLYAGEPDVQQPIAMAFDDRGRLWVAEAYSYPVRVPKDKARDRILIFEDTDGDHKFDKRKVFCEGLNLVSGLELGFGGVYVGAAPEFLFIPDADGNDKPDAEPTVLLDGWGYQDTHETLNSFIWGPDGWLYGCHGVFTHSNVGKPGASDAERTKINAGIWRYHPTRHTFEVFAEGTSNPWGVDFNDRGHAFATACVIPHLYHIIQGARYQRQAGQHFNPHTYDDIKTIAKHRHWVGNQWQAGDRDKSLQIGGGHAHAGAMIYLGGAWPKPYYNQLFMNNIHGARLNQDVLTPEGSGYEGDAAPDFCFANDVWSQIIYLTYGPDGQVTMIDWYDKNQCHHRNDEGHDRTNGRIFKIVHNDAKSVQVDLKKLSSKELLDLQLVKNEWYARHARRILQERGRLDEESFKHYQRLIGFEIVNAEVPKAIVELRFLWTLHVTGDLQRVAPFYPGDDPENKAWVVQLLSEQGTPTATTLEWFKNQAANEHGSPVMRLALSSALQRFEQAARWEIAENLIRHATDKDDHNLPLMYWYAIEPLVMSDPSRAMKLSQESKIPLVSRFIVRRAAAEEKGYEALLTHVAAASEADQTWMLEEITAALKSRANLPMPKAWEAVYDKLIASGNEAIRRQAEFIAVKFGDQRVLPALRKTLVDRKANLDSRKLALDSLVVARDVALPPLLQELLDDAELRLPSLQALAAFDHAATPAAILGKYAAWKSEEQQAALAVVTSRPEYVLPLLDAIEAKKIPRTDLSAFTVRQLAQINHPAVVKRLNEVWGTTRPTSADKKAELDTYKRALQPAELAKADVSQGRVLFQKTCGTCHLLFGEGKTIGPDLTGSNRANLDYLLENLLDPSAVIGKDYQTTMIVTENGRTLSGILRNETDTAITLQTPTEIVTLPKSEIESRTLSNLSLMPDGQLKPMPADDVRNLVAYLSSPSQVPLPGEMPQFDAKTNKVAGAIEGETLKILSKSAGNLGPQGMGGFSKGRWSGVSHLWWTGAKPKDKIVLEVPVKKAGRYEIFVTLSKAVDYGIVQIGWDEEKPQPPIDLYNKEVVNGSPISLGIHDLKAGPHTLTVEITGANPSAAKGYMFGLDYVLLLPREAEKK